MANHCFRSFSGMKRVKTPTPATGAEPATKWWHHFPGIRQGTYLATWSRGIECLPNLRAAQCGTPTELLETHFMHHQ